MIAPEGSPGLFLWHQPGSASGFKDRAKVSLKNNFIYAFEQINMEKSLHGNTQMRTFTEKIKTN